MVAMAGVVLFGLLIWRNDPRGLLRDFSRIGWGMAAVILLGGCSHLVKTWAWRQTFPAGESIPAFPRLLGIRLSGEGISQLSFAGQVVGETTRAMMLRVQMPTITGVSTVVLDRTLYGFVGMLMVVAGALLTLIVVPLSIEQQRYNVLAIVLLIGVAVGAVVLARGRVRVASGLLRRLGNLVGPETWESKVHAVYKVETIVYDFYWASRKAFWKAVLLNLLGHGMAILEVWLILWLIDAGATALDAFIIEAGAKIINLGGLFIPGNLGASEGASMLLLGALGLGAENGLTLAIARRLRGLFWAGAGVLYFYVFMTRSRATEKSG